jgi:uncharacterized protein involved in cysteine biosynthesis
METSYGPTTSYILSLIGGLIVLLYGLMSLVMFGLYGPYWNDIGDWMGGMMGGYHDFMGFYGGAYEFFTVLTIIGLVCGILIVVGAVMLRANPQDHAMWGTVIIIFSAISFVGMGGFFIGAVLGIIGGAFAISYRPRTAGT